MADAAVSSASIVLVGPLSPLLFQPRWLASQSLLAENEAAGIENLVITPDFTQFSTEWLQLNAVAEKLTLTTTLAPYFDPLRDLALSLLALLDSTPLAAVGLNSVAHFSLDTPQRWHRVGHLLAPKVGIWDDILERPGTRRVAVQGERARRPGNVNVVVEPSARVADGIFIEVNDHFTSPAWPDPSTGWAEDVLTGEWHHHRDNADRIFRRLTSLGADDDEGDGGRVG